MMAIWRALVQGRPEAFDIADKKGRQSFDSRPFLCRSEPGELARVRAGCAAAPGMITPLNSIVVLNSQSSREGRSHDE